MWNRVIAWILVPATASTNSPDEKAPRRPRSLM